MRRPRSTKHLPCCPTERQPSSACATSAQRAWSPSLTCSNTSLIAPTAAAEVAPQDNYRSAFVIRTWTSLGVCHHEPRTDRLQVGQNRHALYLEVSRVAGYHRGASRPGDTPDERVPQCARAGPQETPACFAGPGCRVGTRRDIFKWLD